MNTNYHIHIHNLITLLNSQVQQHSQSQQFQYHQNMIDQELLKEILLQIQEIQQKIKLDQENEEVLATDIKTIHSQLNLKKPRSSVIKDCLHSICHGLETTASHVLVGDLISKIHILLSGIR